MRLNERQLVELGFSKANIATFRNMLDNSNGLGSMSTQDSDNVDIDGGVIDNTTIGSGTPSTAAFTTIVGTLTTAAQPNITSLGVILSLVATTADINAGTVDNTVIGGSTPAAGNFTTVDIDGGSVDSATIGLASSSSGAFTTLSNTGLHKRSVTAGITAFATGGQASAVELTTDINVVSIVGTGGDSIKLPTAVAGYSIIIINNGANAMDVFPNTSDDLGAGVDTAVSLAAGSNITYVSYSATNWEVV